MSQFTVYTNTNPKTRKKFPYLLDIQSELLDQIATTVVIPLTPYAIASDQTITKLCPVVDIQEKKYVALTQQLAGINRNLLGPEVVNISDYRTEFIAAIDLIISGI
ncbi:MAG: CcdB family protein [Gammaproteobacteria bacterium]|nr:CcdB family protein [Gammaproteobacteria bacterium]